MTIAFHALPTAVVRAIRAQGQDAYGNPVERHRAAEQTGPCRHCHGTIAAGAEYLILAHRPFRTDNPYAETGPIFLHAEECPAATPGPDMPAVMDAPQYLVRGYDADERIVYGTGQVVPRPEIASYAEGLLAEAWIAFVDIRSARNNCWQARVMRS
ncbi:DUF1203 domain-containing protein [Pseudoroseicyclus sp. H15]